jgi:hypothetical protein
MRCMYECVKEAVLCITAGIGQRAEEVCRIKEQTDG